MFQNVSHFFSLLIFESWLKHSRISFLNLKKYVFEERRDLSQRTPLVKWKLLILRLDLSVRLCKGEGIEKYKNDENLAFFLHCTGLFNYCYKPVVLLTHICICTCMLNILHAQFTCMYIA